MFLCMLIVFCVITIYVCLNYRNKYSIAVSFYMFSIILLSFGLLLYTSKFFSYRYFNQIDYQLYLWLLQSRFQIDTVMWIYNIGIALFLFASVYLVTVFHKTRPAMFLLSMLPIVLLLVWTSPNVCWTVYLYINNAKTPPNDLLRFLFGLCNQLCPMILAVYPFIPFLFLGIYYFRTKIPSKKKSALIAAITVLLMIMLVFPIFVINSYENLNFYNYGMLNMYIKSMNNESVQSNIILMSTAMAMITILIMLFCFKPFYMLILPYKNELWNRNRVPKQILLLLHVYKNCLIGIQKKSGIYSELAATATPEETEQRFNELGASASNMIEQMSKVLFLLRSTKVSYNSINVAECVRTAIDKAAISPNIRCDVSELIEHIQVYGNKDNLTESMVNLLLNSVAAIMSKGNAPGRIRIFMEEEDDTVIVNFYDNGCGIPKSNLHKVFDLFYSTNPHAGFSGTGLSYVKRIVSNHHGDVCVSSQPGEFTLFQLMLPIFHEKTKKHPQGFFFRLTDKKPKSI